MTTTDLLLERMWIDDAMLQVCVGNPEDANNHRWLSSRPSFTTPPPSDRDVYFGPAMRRTHGHTRTDVYGTRVLWIDVDDADPTLIPPTTLAPSAIVWSGHGYHLYWFLRETLTDIDEIETLNKLLEIDCPYADRGCWNANRLLRMPGSMNVGNDDEQPTACELRTIEGTLYRKQDILAIAELDDKTRHRIRTGDTSDFKTRSERDFSVIRALCATGADDDTIALIFETTEVGEKYRREKDPIHYLDQSIGKMRKLFDKDETDDAAVASAEDKAKRKAGPKRPAAPTLIVEKNDGYYMVGSTSRRISTFTLDPLVLLDGIIFHEEDALVCDVRANGHTWKGVSFPRSAFNSVSAMDKNTPLAAWQWLGHESDVRQLLPYLMDKLRAKGLPRVAATPMLGLHYVDGVPYFLGDKQTVTAGELYEGAEGPLTWLPVEREHPHIDLTTTLDDDAIDVLAENLPFINQPNVVWPMLGWYAATCMKPWLEAHNIRFPILNVTGTKGSGKTTLTQRIFMPLFGQTDAKGYDAGTTHFVKLALLGSSNAVPIAFSEFRYDAVEKFIRTVLMAYDTGHDPRGRADQTTQDYPLSAPFSVDGEDVIADAAARERIIVARLRPNTIAEDSPCFDAFRALRAKLPSSFGGYYIQRCLQAITTGHADVLLERAREFIQDAFPSRLPDRVRNNYIVVMFGCLLFENATGITAPPAAIFTESIGEVVNLESGRSRTLVDEFVESVVNAVKMYGNVGFQHYYDLANGILYFQLSSAHSWWLSQRRRQGRGALERDAMRAQLKEASYAREAATYHGTWMHAVSVKAAAEYGLDVSTELTQGFRFNFKAE